MKVYRIADRRYPLLDGMGAFLTGGRWNSRGHRVIYAAETYAGALLEQLAHANIGKLPNTQAYIEIDIPDDVAVSRVTAAELPGWNDANLEASRNYGDAWYKAGQTAVLFMPSAVTCGMESNVLINQAHQDYPRITASDPHPVKWDPRIIRT